MKALEVGQVQEPGSVQISQLVPVQVQGLIGVANTKSSKVKIHVIKLTCKLINVENAPSAMLSIEFLSSLSSLTSGGHLMPGLTARRRFLEKSILRTESKVCGILILLVRFQMAPTVVWEYPFLGEPLYFLVPAFH